MYPDFNHSHKFLPQFKTKLWSFFHLVGTFNQGSDVGFFYMRSSISFFFFFINLYDLSCIKIMMKQSFCYKDKNEWQIVMADILVITTNLEHCSSLCNGQFSIKRSKSFYKTIYALVQSHIVVVSLFFSCMARHFWQWHC